MDSMIEPTDLIGTWKFSREGQPAFLHFTYTQAFDYLEDGERRQLLRLWYELEGGGWVRFRNQRDEEGWTCGLTLNEGTLVIHGEHMKTACTRARAEEIPEWFTRELAGK